MSTQQLAFQFGTELIRSYKRLSYTPWFALAEFVDNSTQSYFDNREQLDAAFKQSGQKLTVSITYDKDSPGGLLRIVDNAMGMSFEDLQRALTVGMKPPDPTGRSRYGMGMKTAACWFGDEWSIRTKKLGESTERQIEVDVEAVAAGRPDLPHREVDGKSIESGYTVIEIRKLHRKLYGQTQRKIREYLRSIYRRDISSDTLILEWQGVVLPWAGLDAEMLLNAENQPYKKSVDFTISNGKRVTGWVGVLKSGGRDKAGFAMLHQNRVLMGAPEAWRPSEIFGQAQGSNDLVNQRLVGEIALDDFEVSHTKDNISWEGDEEDEVDKGLAVACVDYRRVALDFRKGQVNQGPTDMETAIAVIEVKRELESPEMVDQISIQEVASPEAIEATLQSIVRSVTARPETFTAVMGSNLRVRCYLERLSVSDPYVVDDSPDQDEVVVIVNVSHPHVFQIGGSDGMANYLRHCIYDAVAEWQARKRLGATTPDTIRMIKDGLLRVPMDIQSHAAETVA